MKKIPLLEEISIHEAVDVNSLDKGDFIIVDHAIHGKIEVEVVKIKNNQIWWREQTKGIMGSVKSENVDKIEKLTGEDKGKNLHWFTTDKEGNLDVQEFDVKNYQDILKLFKVDGFFITQDFTYPHFINKIDYLLREGITLVAVLPKAGAVNDGGLDNKIMVYFDYDMGSAAYMMERDRFLELPEEQQTANNLP
jgi:hypothetical protein